MNAPAQPARPRDYTKNPVGISPRLGLSHDELMALLYPLVCDGEDVLRFTGVKDALRRTLMLSCYTLIGQGRSMMSLDEVESPTRAAAAWSASKRLIDEAFGPEKDKT